MLVLQTRRLLLRGGSEDDVDFALDMYSRPEVQRFIGRFSEGDVAAQRGAAGHRWHFHPEAWGHGYATESAARLLQYAFAAGLNEVVAVTNVANTASQSVAERIGMTRAGQATRYYNMPLQLFTADRLAG